MFTESKSPFDTKCTITAQKRLAIDIFAIHVLQSLSSV